MLSNMVTFKDNQPGSWYYEAIQEAAYSHSYERTNKLMPGRTYNLERWISLIPNRDWTVYEK